MCGLDVGQRGPRHFYQQLIGSFPGSVVRGNLDGCNRATAFCIVCATIHKLDVLVGAGNEAERVVLCKACRDDCAVGASFQVTSDGLWCKNGRGTPRIRLFC